MTTAGTTQIRMSRRFLVAVVALVLAAGAAVITWQWPARLEPVQWQVASSGADGHSVYVRVAGLFSHCDPKARVELVSADASAVKLRVRKGPATCGDQNLRWFPPYRVEIGRRLAGQKIEGQGKIAGLINAGPRERYVMPRVLQLAPGDARDALIAVGFPTVPTAPAGSGLVSAQSPKPGAHLPNARDPNNLGDRYVTAQARLTWGNRR